MSMFDLAIFLKPGSNKEDVKNVALELIVRDVRSFHMSENNDYIIVFGYQSKTWEDQFSKIPGISSTFMRIHDHNDKPNSQELVREISAPAKNDEPPKIQEPYVMKRSKSVTDALPEIRIYTNHIARQIEKSGPHRFKMDSMLKSPINVKKSGRSDLHNQQFPELITPDVWRKSFSDYATKYGILNAGSRIYAKGNHPRKILNTYIVYLHTKAWDTTQNFVSGKLNDYCSAGTARNHIENWSIEGVLQGLLNIYEHLSDNK
jgi:hypothetical protein